MSKTSIEPRGQVGLWPLLAASSVSAMDLWRIAEASALGMLAYQEPGGGLSFQRTTMEQLAHSLGVGSQEYHTLSDDLLLVRSDLRGMSSVRYAYDLRGWLYLHFRLEGLSEEEMPGGRRRLDRECFVLSASSQPSSVVREVVGDTWRTVGIACRPAFAQRDLRCLGDNLPEELRRFRSGDEVDFAFVGELTAEMRAAARSLLSTTLPPGIRDTYYRAKVVELVCLALGRISARDEVATDLPVRLSRRDVECIEQTRRFLLTHSAPSLSQLARHVGINRNKLAVGFKHIFGVTVGDFDRECRLERARALLESGEMPISYVADLAGYADHGSFSKAFKLEYGVLPSELRGAAPTRK